MSRILPDRSFTIAHHVDCGIALMKCNRHIQALLEFEIVLKLDPENIYARWNRCLALLSLGDYAQGMPEHDWAWKIYDWRALGPVQGNVDRILELPQWNGENCRLIIYHEMGFGDAIMCLRFLPDIVKRCKSVTLVVRPELVSLMSGYGAEVVGSVPLDMSDYEARVTLFNSMWVGGWHHCIPTDPYVEVDFDFDGGKLGIAWSGNSQQNFTLLKFLSRLNISGYELFALQKAKASVYELSGVQIHPLRCESFKETAQLMATMDAVVTVDTSAAHLAGAIGHPNAHVVMPFFRDWRWWNKDRWYPTLNIYPQDDPADWDTPFQKVNEAMRDLQCIS